MNIEAKQDQKRQHHIKRPEFSLDRSSTETNQTFSNTNLQWVMSASLKTLSCQTSIAERSHLQDRSYLRFLGTVNRYNKSVVLTLAHKNDLSSLHWLKPAKNNAKGKKKGDPMLRRKAVVLFGDSITQVSSHHKKQ